jgi:hypothetical protein
MLSPRTIKASINTYIVAAVLEKHKKPRGVAKIKTSEPLAY